MGTATGCGGGGDAVGGEVHGAAVDLKGVTVGDVADDRGGRWRLMAGGG